MTLVIAAPGEDFIILGADSRAVMDSGDARIEINNINKIILINDYVAMLIYGTTDVATRLVEKYKTEKKPETISTTQIAEDFAELCRTEEKKLAGVPRNPKSIGDTFGFIIAGLEKTGDHYIPSAYNISNYDGFRVGLCKPYAIQGKPLIARYIFAKKYNEKLNVNDLCQLVAQSIYDTERIDGDVGGKIRITIIDSNGLREIATQDIDELVEGWELKELVNIME